MSQFIRHPIRLTALVGLVASLVSLGAPVVASAQAHVEHLLSFRSPLPLEVVRDARGALRDADAAAVASGTAVLEAALIGTPAVALYVMAPAQAKIARRIYRGQHITLPNLVVGETVVPELLQEAAAPAALRVTPTPERTLQ